MTDLVFFYGTLMSGFKRRGRDRIDAKLTPVGRGWIHAALFDLGLYPGAIPTSDAKVLGELYRMADSEAVLIELDAIEGFTPGEPDASLYLRTVAPFYPFLAAGIALYFASQGAGQVAWPVLSGTARLVLDL